MMPGRLKRLLISDGAKICDAMRAIEAGAAEIALVVDDEDRLIGALSDGDIRRPLLQGARLDSSVCQYVNRNIRAVREGTGRAEVLDIMRAHCIQQIPIVDEFNRVVGLHLLQEILGAAERPNWAVIMAGGRGRRLSPGAAGYVRIDLLASRATGAFAGRHEWRLDHGRKYRGSFGFPRERSLHRYYGSSALRSHGSFRRGGDAG